LNAHGINNFSGNQRFNNEWQFSRNNLNRRINGADGPDGNSGSVRGTRFVAHAVIAPAGTMTRGTHADNSAPTALTPWNNLYVFEENWAGYFP